MTTLFGWLVLSVALGGALIIVALVLVGVLVPVLVSVSLHVCDYS